jgi:hypothetical protein
MSNILKRLKAPRLVAVSGVVLGAAFGWLAGIGTLAGAGGGAVVGGIIGSVIGLETPEFEALQYDDKMNGGKILISVHTADGTERECAKGIFKNAGAVTAAEAVVDHAHGRSAPAAPVA